MPLDREAIIAGITPAPPDLARLETVVTLCEQRCKRAKEKLDLAAGKVVDAETALKCAISARADWIENNPDPQMMLL